MALANNKGLSDKVVSERHYYASQSKYTAGEVGKILSKALKEKNSAKDVVNCFKNLYNRDPEWHRSGFYKGGNGRKTMGKTYFFSSEELEELEVKWEVGQKILKEKQEEEKEINRRAEKKRKYAQRYGTRFHRVTSLPEFADVEYSEMHGKYGWFVVENYHNYSLTGYYSGVFFKSKKNF